MHGSTVGAAGAISSADSGSAPLAAVVAYQLRLPAVFIRETPKKHLLSYGGDPATNHALLAGERIEPGTAVHLIDDLVRTGVTLARANPPALARAVAQVNDAVREAALVRSSSATRMPDGSPACRRRPRSGDEQVDLVDEAGARAPGRRARARRR